MGISFEVSADELAKLRKGLKLESWVESMSDEDKQRLMESFSNPADALRVTRELAEKYGGEMRKEVNDEYR